ncbi:MAG: hypothetical protein R8J85_02580 [Mariprofundales bacterium]
MTSCACCDPDREKKPLSCPACGQRCLPVSKHTMLHQLQFPDNQHLAEGDYAFCANVDCLGGYFSQRNRIAKSQLRAFQSSATLRLCHCFDISESSYRVALTNGTAQAIKAFVIQQTKDGLCACESRNPSGRCCLASFRRLEQDHRAKS